MLVQFTFNNFKCFADETTLSMMAANKLGKGYYTIPTSQRYSVLKAAAVFGANGSGKTKLFEAFAFMKKIICPPKRDSKTPIADYWITQYDRFRLNTKYVQQTSSFEVIFLVDNIQYRYGLEVNAEKIVSEWLYAKHNREVRILEREENEKIIVNYKHIKSAIVNNLLKVDMLSPTTPFISLLATFNDSLSQQIVNWFDSVRIISANNMDPTDTFGCMDNNNPVTELMRAFDFNIEGLKLHEIPFDELPEKISNMIGKGNSTKIVDGVLVSHKTFDENYERVDNTNFRMEKDESFGTNRLFSLVGPIFNALSNGTVLMIDEVDSGLHTNIVRFILGLFYVNTKNAQVIVNSQNTSLIDINDIQDEHKLLRKDQIYIVSKNSYGESRIASFSDYKLPYKAERLYLDGALGGVPHLNINDFEKLLKNTIYEQ